MFTCKCVGMFIAKNLLVRFGGPLEICSASLYWLCSISTCARLCMLIRVLGAPGPNTAFSSSAVCRSICSASGYFFYCASTVAKLFEHPSVLASVGPRTSAVRFCNFRSIFSASASIPCSPSTCASKIIAPRVMRSFVRSNTLVSLLITCRRICSASAGLAKLLSTSPRLYMLCRII